MALRGKKPEDRETRIKALLFGPAGVGKTIAAIQMPKPYIIDTEGGSVHYGEQIEAVGGTVFASNDLEEVIAEVRSLMTERHSYRSLIIDPFTTLYETELDKGEVAKGDEFGRHFGYAAKGSKRLFNLLSMLDMNVIMTAHSKNVYGDQMKVVGQTFDGWKKLDYLFDLVFQLDRRGPKRFATVRKTRLAQFPDQDSFEWSFQALAERYGADRLDRDAVPVNLATPDQITLFLRLAEVLGKDKDAIQAGVEKAGAATLEEMHRDTLEKWNKAMTKDLKAKGLSLEGGN